MVYIAISNTQWRAMAQISRAEPAAFNNTCRFDQGVIDHLDLFSNEHGLFSWLNQTKTAMGARHLRQWLRHPLINVADINQRQRLIIHLMENEADHQMLIESLSGVNDIERLLSKICSRFHNPRDCLALRDALRSLPTITQWLASVGMCFRMKRISVQAFAKRMGWCR